MKLKLYAIYDTVSCVYDRPWCSHNDSSALRLFSDIACDENHPVGKHPEHYQLYRIGRYDDNNGVIEPESAVCIGKAQELVSAHGLHKSQRELFKQKDTGGNGEDRESV